MDKSPTQANREFKPEIVVLYCQHAVLADAAIPEKPTGTAECKARLAMMPCSSKVEAEYILKILSQGADGVEVVTCPEGECRFLVGNVRAGKRIEYARQLLESTPGGPARLGLTRAEGLSAKDLLDLATARAKAVQPLGPTRRQDGDK